MLFISKAAVAMWGPIKIAMFKQAFKKRGRITSLLICTTTACYCTSRTSFGFKISMCPVLFNLTHNFVIMHDLLNCFCTQRPSGNRSSKQMIKHLYNTFVAAAGHLQCFVPCRQKTNLTPYNPKRAKTGTGYY